MNVANKDLCAELYELTGGKLLSGWGSTYFYYTPNEDVAGGWYINPGGGTGSKDDIPAYSLEFLLRKLPPEATIKRFKYPEVEGYEAEYNWIGEDGTGEGVSCGASIPEDAAAELCIELIKQGILLKERA